MMPLSSVPRPAMAWVPPLVPLSMVQLSVPLVPPAAPAAAPLVLLLLVQLLSVPLVVVQLVVVQLSVPLVPPAAPAAVAVASVPPLVPLLPPPRCWGSCRQGATLGKLPPRCWGRRRRWWRLEGPDAWRGAAETPG